MRLVSVATRYCSRTSYIDFVRVTSILANRYIYIYIYIYIYWVILYIIYVIRVTLHYYLLLFAGSTEQREETACGATKYVCKCSLRNVYITYQSLLA